MALACDGVPTGQRMREFQYAFVFSGRIWPCFGGGGWSSDKMAALWSLAKVKTFCRASLSKFDSPLSVNLGVSHLLHEKKF